MCCGCVSTAQKVWSFGLGIIFLAFSITLGVLWPKISTNIINGQLQLTEYTANYQSWIKSPFPVRLEFYVFNFTNFEEFNGETSEERAYAWANIKPKFHELGPFVFDGIHERVDVDFDDDENGVRFNQTKTYWFREDLSNGTLDDPMTTLSPVPLGVNYFTRYLGRTTKRLINTLMNSRSSLFTSATVRDFIIDPGHEQPIKPEEYVDLPEIPWDQIGWGAIENGSAIKDGRFEIYTGKDDINKLGILKTWNGEETLGFLSGECAKVKGTMGEIWPPVDTKTPGDLDVFISEVCRSFVAKYEGKHERHGITGWKWVGDERAFDNGHNYPETACFCTAHEDDCPNIKPGIFNATVCQDAPIFASQPHFYLADESYLEPIEGLSPEKDKHEVSVMLEPNFGIPLEIKARIQYNFFLRNDPAYTFYKEVPDMYIPSFWFAQIAELPEKEANEAKMLFLIRDVGMWACYTLAAVGSAFVLLGVFFIFYKRTPEPSIMKLT